MYTHSRRGFTLIELLVVIAIIGILASIILASLNTARKRGRDARRVSDMKQVQLALQLYYDEHQSTYPMVNGNNGVTMSNTQPPGLVSNYISTMPTDPSGSTNPYVYQSTNATSSERCTTAAGCPGFIIRAVLETGATKSILTDTHAGVNCTPNNGPGNNYCLTHD
jgi:type II secretion system protein G